MKVTYNIVEIKTGLVIEGGFFSKDAAMYALQEYNNGGFTNTHKVVRA